MIRRLAAIICLLSPAAAAQEADLIRTARVLFGVVAPAAPETVRAPDAVLGRLLFWDERLSADGRTSCASCHLADDWGADARRFSRDARGRLTGRHSQTVFNAAAQTTLRWLGDREDAAAQARGSLTGSMGFDRADDVVPLLRQFGYEDAFRAAFPGDDDPVTTGHYAWAIQAYLRTLATPSPFDAFLAGDRDALTAEQQAGLALFVSSGCANCHSGPLLGGASFRRFGILQDYWTATGSDPVDPGRYALTQQEADRYVFRTPMLRNVARTAPYFHDGSVASLADAVRVMARVQAGRDLPDADARRIAAFLESLTGEIPAHYADPRRRDD
jgi:cytochrome c peroxidase